MQRSFQDKQPIRGDERHSTPSCLPCRHARSALYLDPMLLTPTTGAAVAIAIAIPAERGQAGRGGTALI